VDHAAQGGGYRGCAALDEVCRLYKLSIEEFVAWILSTYLRPRIATVPDSLSS